MNWNVEALLTQFDDSLSQMKSRFEVDMVADRIAVVRPMGYPREAAKVRDVRLTLLGLVHGVEVAGLAVVAEIARRLANGELNIEGPLGLALGNIPAALKGVRFIERDLNRSFARDARDTAEDRRADELEVLLRRTQVLLDLHQVKLQSASPFWIFPYHTAGFALARQLAPDVPVVTHWGKSFSADGQCSDEFVIKTGASGITMELGQNGFDPEQIKRGIDLAVRAVQVVDGGQILNASTAQNAGIYTWAEVIPYPATGAPVLDPGWANFARVEAGQRVGAFQDVPVKAPVGGWMLFPKYPEPRSDGNYGAVPPAAELVRIMKRIQESDLPEY